MSVDFNSLPKPNFVEVIDYEAILAERVEYFISLYPIDEQATVRKTLSPGKGEDTITLKGTTYHELTHSRVTLDQIRAMADTGKAYTLIEGTGKIYGLVIIESLDETKTYFFKDGAARKTDFTITLKVIKEWQPTLMGSLIGMAAGALNRAI